MMAKSKILSDWSASGQKIIRDRIMEAPEHVAAGLIKALHNDPVHGCSCGQDHDWVQTVRQIRGGQGG